MRRAVVALWAVSLCAQQVDWVTQVRRGPVLDPRTYNWSSVVGATTGNRVSVDLSTAGSKTATFTGCPNGISASASYPGTIVIDSSNGTFSVSGATNARPIVITTTAAHGLSTANMVRITGVTGNTAANGYWVITVLSPTTFSLTNSWGNGAYVNGGSGDLDEWVTITGGTCTDSASSGTLTFTTVNPHSGTTYLRSGSSGVFEALNDSASVGGAPVYIPAGVHDFVGPLYNPLCIPMHGENEAYSVLRMMSTGHHGLVVGPSAYASACKANIAGIQVNYHQSAVANATWTYKVVTGATNNGALVRLTTSTNHGLATNDLVHVSGISGVTGATGRFPVTYVSDTVVDLQGSTFGGSFVSGGNGLLRVLGGGWELQDYSLVYFQNISEGRVQNLTSYGGYNGIGMFYVANTPTFTNVKVTADNKGFAITCGATVDCQNQLIGHGLHARPQPGGDGFYLGPKTTGFNCTNCWSENGAYNLRFVPSATVAGPLNEIRFVSGFFDEATTASVAYDNAAYYTNNDVQFVNMRIGTLQPLAGNFILRSCNGVQIVNSHVYSPGDGATIEDCSNVSIRGNDWLGYQPVEATVWTPRSLLLQGATRGPVTGLHVTGNRMEKHVYPTNFTNATPIVVTVPTGHGISSAQRIIVGGVRGNTAANGIRYACSVGATSISLFTDAACSSAVAGSGAYVAQSGIIATPMAATIAADTANHVGNTITENRMMGDMSWTIAAGNNENRIWGNNDPSLGVATMASATSLTLQPAYDTFNITNAASAVTQMIGCFNGRRITILATTSGLAFNTGGTAPGDIGAALTTSSANQVVVGTCVAGKWYLQ